jgi:hypothetical protein
MDAVSKIGDREITIQAWFVCSTFPRIAFFRLFSWEKVTSR